MDLQEWLNNLYVPKSKDEEFKELCSAVAMGDLVPFSQEIKGAAIPIVKILTQGNPPRVVFKGTENLYCDTGPMGEKWGAIAVYKDPTKGVTPTRFKYSAYKYLLIEKF